jgi:hypothetical protein
MKSPFIPARGEQYSWDWGELRSSGGLFQVGKLKIAGNDARHSDILVQRFPP